MRGTTYSIFVLFCLLFTTAAWGQNVVLEAKVFLQGPYQLSTMDDDLRTANLIPLEEPYTALGYTHVGGGGGERIDPAVLGITGNDAIVDWVVTELRQVGNPSNILATRAALVQRDGDVVDVNGSCPVRFEGLTPGDYHVAIRHRNHLGVMTQGVVNLQADPLDCFPDIAMIDDVYIRDNQPDPSDIEFYDKWGNGYTSVDLEVKRLKGNINCTNTGFFTLLFSGGFPADQEAVICKVFEDLSNIIIPADPSIEVFITVDTSSAFTNPDILATGSPFWDKRECGIGNSVIEKILLGGDASSYSSIHGEMRVNNRFTNEWFTNLVFPPTSSDDDKYHLYTIILHEALHILGFGSNISDTGVPRVDNIYSRYDQFLFTQDGGGNFLVTPDATNTACCSAHQFNITTSSLRTNDCNNLFFRNSTTNIAPVDGGLSGGVPNLLSHFNIGCSPSDLYVMHPSVTKIGLNAAGQYPIRDNITCSELEVLALLGYDINTTVTTCGSLPTNCDVLVVDDIFYYDFSNSISLSISSDILSNDIINGTPNFSYTSVTSGLTISQSGDILNITTTSPGVYDIEYEVSSCAGQCDEGIIRLIIIDPSLVNCSNTDCNLISCYGDFELFESDEELQFILNGSPPFLFTPYINTPDLQIPGGRGGIHSCSVFNAFTANYSSKIVLLGFGQTPDDSEGVAFPMQDCIKPGQSGTISFSATTSMNCINSNGNPYLRIEFCTNPPVSGEIIYTNPGVSNYTLDVNISSTFPSFATYTVNYTNNTSDIWNYLLISGQHTSINTLSGRGSILIDDVSIIKDNKQITITPSIDPNNVCTGGTVLLQYELENPHGSPSGNVDINLNIPSSDLTLLSGGTFNNGSNTVSIGEIAPNNSVTVTALIKVNSSANGQYNIPLTVTPSGCYQPSSATAQINVVNNPLANLTKSHTISSSGGIETYTFAITVCNALNQALEDIVIEDEVPTNFTVTNPNGFTVTGDQLAISIDLPANACQTLTYEAQVSTNFCQAKTCAVAKINDSGCGTLQTCETLTDPDRLPIDPDFTHSTISCVASTVQFTSNSTAGTTHFWNFGDGNTSNAISPTHSYAAPGSYIVYHRISSACPSVEKERMISVKDCSSSFQCNCTNNTQIGDPLGGNTNISAAAIPLNYNNTGACLQVGGRIIIDNNFTINGGEIVFEPSAEIVVPANRTLTITNADLKSCGNFMWNGIVVEADGALIFTDNTIADAQNAIEVQANSIFDILDNTFDRNRTGLYVSGTPNATSEIIDNTFDCTSTLNSGFWGLRGLYVKNAFLVLGSISVSIIEQNVFQATYYGIVADNSLIIVFDAIIHSLTYDPTARLLRGSDNNSIGVLGINSSNLQIGSCFFDQVHEGIRADNSSIGAKNNMMTQVDRGIEAEDFQNFQGLNISNNNMQVSEVGIYIKNAFCPLENMLHDNTINVDWLANMYIPNSDLGPWIRGIHISTFIDNSGGAVNLSIDNNTINMQHENSPVDTDAQGIRVDNSNGVDITNNTITNLADAATPGNGAGSGILLSACQEVLVQENTITDDVPAGTGINCIESSNTQDAAFCCNEANAGNVGMQFLGSCNPSYLNQNQIGGDLTGLQCFWNTIIGEQVIYDDAGNRVQHRGNEFIGNNSQYGARHWDGNPAVVDASRFFVPDTNPPFYPMSSGIPVDPIDFFIIEGLLPPNPCNVLEECADVDGAANDITFADLTISGSGGASSRSSNGFGNDMLNWEAGQYLVEKLEKHPNLWGQHPSIDNYVLAQSDMQQLWEVKRYIRAIQNININEIQEQNQRIDALIEELASLKADYKVTDEEDQAAILLQIKAKSSELTNVLAQQQRLKTNLKTSIGNQIQLAAQANRQVQTNNKFGQQEQFLNDAYIQYLLDNDLELNRDQIEEIFTIANQCPSDGGQMVGKARALYNLLIEKRRFDNSELCNQ